MRETPPTYYPGLEFFVGSTGLTGIVNAPDGSQSTYTNLSVAEAKAWLEAWLNGETWMRL